MDNPINSITTIAKKMKPFAFFSILNFWGNSLIYKVLDNYFLIINLIANVNATAGIIKPNVIIKGVRINCEIPTSLKIATIPIIIPTIPEKTKSKIYNPGSHNPILSTFSDLNLKNITILNTNQPKIIGAGIKVKTINNLGKINKSPVKIVKIEYIIADIKYHL